MAIQIVTLSGSARTGNYPSKALSLTLMSCAGGHGQSRREIIAVWPPVFHLAAESCSISGSKIFTPLLLPARHN